jgi:hypothetical protein
LDPVGERVALAAAGGVIAIVVDDELSATQLASIAFGVAVVTPGIAADVAAGPDAVVAAASSGVVVLTPE